MVVGAFPVAKLAALFVKQISKPIANLAKERAKSHPIFRTYICMPPAQFYNWCEIKTKMWLLNMGKPVNVPVLSEAMAIELGANLLGEGIIFIIAAGILLAEYNRQLRKEAAKEQARLDELERIHNYINELQYQVAQQEGQIKDIVQALTSLESSVGKKRTSWNNNKPKKEPKQDCSPPPPGTSLKLRTTNDDPIKYSSQFQPVSNGNNGHTSVISNALLYLENDVFYEPENQRNNGLITKGLEYLYYNSFIVTSVS